MKTGIIICTHNRSDLLKQCLESINNADIKNDVLFFIVDDCSTETNVVYLVTDFSKNHLVKINTKTSNKGIHDSLLIGFERAFYSGCDVVINLDSDAVINKEAINILLELHNQFPHTIVTGFNTLICDATTKQPRHPIISTHDKYFKKRSIGGINMCMNKMIYDKYVRHELNRYNWDWRVCHNLQMDNKYFIVSNPSCVQHIGIGEGMHVNQPDFAEDFKM